MFPTAFVAQMQDQLGAAEYEDFLSAFALPVPVSVRRNPLKLKNWQENYDGVKWNNEGVYLPDRPIFTLDPRLHGGAYYVQEASSMLLSAVLEQTVDLAAPLKVLDLAAAPGGKSTLLAAALSAESLLISNEVIKTRYQILRENLSKWGYPNVICTNQDSREFAPLQGQFDLVLLDAPCSGEGLFRKDPTAMKEWSPEHVQFCASRQHRILAEASPLLKPGGILIYCTCTYNDFENALNVQWSQDNLDLVALPLVFPAEWGVQAREFGYQCYPHRVKGEGFFIAAFRQEKKHPLLKASPAKGFWKTGNRKNAQGLDKWLNPEFSYLTLESPHGELAALPKACEAFFMELSPSLRRWDPILELGTFKHQDFIPAPALALSTVVHPTLPNQSLDLSTALKYLRKDVLELTNVPDGWSLVNYENVNLGWIKSIKGRINNYYPKEWRIRMATPNGPNPEPKSSPD
jgi:16S rRNA C967 or C1407 C5-methylase (RsmB/RsmF family)/NOL1/NOP2/fmu family ribosome biogenesis protein